MSFEIIAGLVVVILGRYRWRVRHRPCSRGQ